MPADRIDQPTLLDTELESIRPSPGIQQRRDSRRQRRAGLSNPADDDPQERHPRPVSSIRAGGISRGAGHSHRWLCRLALFNSGARQDDSVIRHAAPHENHVRLYRLNEMIYSLVQEAAAEDKDNKDEKAPSRRPDQGRHQPGTLTLAGCPGSNRQRRPKYLEDSRANAHTDVQGL